MNHDQAFTASSGNIKIIKGTNSSIVHYFIT